MQHTNWCNFVGNHIAYSSWLKWHKRAESVLESDSPDISNNLSYGTQCVELQICYLEVNRKFESLKI